jgi:glucosamine--fructose-6-phosphate aminotransferase (isomerizing)
VSDWYDPAVYPELRPGPPWVMEEMIAAQADVVAGVAGSDVSALALGLRGPGPVAVAGCGTSHHAAMGIAEMLREAGTHAVARQAFEASLDPQRDGWVLGVSHEAGTPATGDALRAARVAGSATGLVTAVPDGPVAEFADAIATTPLVDRSWCHTVGYTSPLAVGLALAVGGGLAGEAGAAIAAGSSARPAARAAAAALHECDRLLVAGSGADRISARELTLKIEEACHLPTAMRDVETLLHGHLPAADGRTGLVLVLTERRAGGRRRARAEAMLRACARVGIRCAVLATEPVADGLAAAGQVTVPEASGLPAAAAALLGAAVPLQLLALELALARGRNPDLIRREEAAYREAAAVAEAG